MVNNKIKIAIYGVTGRMGKQLLSLLNNNLNFAITGSYSRSKGGNIDELCKSSEVIIDFSSPEGSLSLIPYAKRHKTKLVIGTTGITDDQFKTIEEAAESLPIVYSANMSYGVAIANYLLKISASLLSPDEFDAAIIDKHHKYKKDSPSGTALMLASTIKNTWKDVVDNGLCNISFSSVKIGNIIGEHEVIFASEKERIAISHIAETREIFAAGAIKAAKWLYDKPAGLYTLVDILGIK